MKDIQADRVYKWEDSFTLWPGAYATQTEIKRTIRKACNLYRIPAPDIQFPTKDRRRKKDSKKKAKLPSTYEPGSHTIRIRPRHMNRAVALHETAHAITDYILGEDLEVHGRHWLSVYINLLAHYKVSRREALELTAKIDGLDFVPLDKTKPATIRKSFPALASAQRARFRIQTTVRKMIAI